MEMNSDEEIEKVLNEGKLKLMKMEWSESEHCFLSVVNQLGMKSSENEAVVRKEDGYDWIRLEALTGLGEVEARRSQRFCHNDFIWLRYMFRSLTFYKAALQYLPEKQVKTNCSRSTTRNSVQNARPYNSPRLQEAAFYNQSESKIQYQIKIIENLTNVALSEKILENCLISIRGKPLTFDGEWLKQLLIFCSKDKEQDIQKDSKKQNVISQELTRYEENKNFQPIYKRKIDYERVQEAIMRLVNDVSIDVRRHYSHMTRLVPQKLVQQRLMLEISRRLTPGTRDNLDLMQVLESAIVYEDINTENKRDKKSETLAGGHGALAYYDEDQVNDNTLYFDVGQIKSQETLALHEYQESQSSIYVRDPTGPSSPSCQSKKSQYNRFLQLQQLETSSSGKSQMTCEKTISSCRSIFDAGSAVPSKNIRMKNILTIWRASRRQSSICRTESSAAHKRICCDTRSVEKISPLSEQEKVLKWLQGVEEPTSFKVLKPSNVQGIDTTGTSCNRRNFSESYSSDFENNLQKILTPRDIDYTIASSIKQAAEIFSDKDKHYEALEMYKFAFNVLKSMPSKRKHENETIADLLRNIGMSKCALGQISSGCQLMQESVGLYSQLDGEKVMSRVGEIWYQLGGAFLSEELRKDSLFMRVMQLIQEELDKEQKKDLLHSPEEDFRGDDESDSSDKSDDYCICIFEAAQCYKQAMNLFTVGIKSGNLPNTELYLKIICDLADCYFMLGHLDLAEARYEEALLLFPRVRGSSTIKENSHVLSMLGSLNFLLGNFVRAATMFETSHILNQHRIGDSGELDEATLQQAWNLAMLGLSCYNLGHFDKTVAWCTRAFSLYTRILRGALFNADYYNHWFVVENLYSLGTAYVTMDFFDKGVYYLNLGRNLINGCEVPERQDTKQHVKVLRALADAHASLEETEVALRFYEEAVEVSKKLGENNTKTALENQLLNRMACVNVDAYNFSVAGTNLEQALDYQKDVEASIKADMAAVLRRLGATSILACDVDKAIACYRDCIQAYNEMEWLVGRDEEVVKMLCTLAILYHVKSCTTDDENQVELFITISEGCFQEAIVIAENNPLDISTRVESCIDLQYANFLYQQGLFADAAQALLPLVFCRRYENDTLVYSGIEQAVLPDHLQSDFNDDSMVVEVQVMAYFLAVICYKSLGLMSDADDALVLLYKYALRPCSSAFACNICAYALMEMSLFREAGEMFFISSLYKHPRASSTMSGVNFWICLCVSAYVTLTKAISGIHEFLIRALRSRMTKSSSPCGFDNDSQLSLTRRQNTSETGSDLAICSDIGEVVETYEEWTEEYFPEPWMISLIKPSLDNAVKVQQQLLCKDNHVDEKICNHNFLETKIFSNVSTDRIFNQLNDRISKEINGNHLENVTDVEDPLPDEEWVTTEEVVDTPVEILVYLSSTNQVSNQLIASS